MATPEPTKSVNGRGLSEKIWSIASRVAVILTVALATAMVTHEVRLATMDVRIVAIESTRWTDMNAAAQSRDMREWTEKRLDSFPPLWLREDLREIKALQKDESAKILLQLQRLEERLRNVEAKVGSAAEN